MKTVISILPFLLLSSIALQAQDETLDATLKRLEKQIADLNTKVQTLTAAAEKAEENAVPVGAIVAFGGPESEIPDGWLPCHGQSLETSKYPKLAEALAKSWGGNSSGTKFNLPDLRGQFLRGWDENADNDPDKMSRTSKNGGNSGNKVGSYQEDEVEKHNHPLKKDKNVIEYYQTSPPSGNATNSPSTYHSNRYNSTDTGYHVGETGGSETRPKNANVIFIIKAE
jgi:microcystin-dependent protein